MPLLRKKPFTPMKPPGDLTGDEEVFLCEMTGEIFRDYEKFYQRMILCNSLVWSCQCTGKAGLTYKEAVESEENVRKTLNEIPSALRTATLLLVHHTKRGRVQNLSDDIFDFLKNRYQPEEIVEVKCSDGWRKSRICQCPDETNVRLISKQMKEPKTIASFFKTPEKDESSKENSISASNKRSSSPIDQIDSLPDPTASLYKIEVMAGKEKGDQVVLKGKSIRRFKGLWTKDKTKMFIKQTCIRTTPSSDDGYWVVKKELVSKFVLGTSSITPNKSMELPPAIIKQKKAKSKGKEKSLAEIRDKQKEKDKERKRKERERAKEKERKEKIKEKEKAKKLEAAQPAISLEERRRMKELEQAKREAEKRRKFMEKELEKAKKREEVQKEKELATELKKIESDFIKEWLKPREDLLLEDLKSLPTFKPLKSDIGQDLIGDVIMVVEFVNVFGPLFSIDQEIEDKVTLDYMIKALLEHDAEGNYYDIMKFLLHTHLRVNQEESNMDDEDAASTSGETTPNEGEEDAVNQTETQHAENKASKNARAAAVWPMLHQGMALSEISIEPYSLTEVLRLHIMSSGVKIGGHRDWNDWQRRGACQYSDDPCVDFRHKETQIMTTLMTSSVYDLPVEDKLKLLVLLCNQILMLQTTRDQIEEAFDSTKDLRRQLRELQNEENKRRKKLSAEKYKQKVAERAKLKEEKEKIKAKKLEREQEAKLNKESQVNEKEAITNHFQTVPSDDKKDESSKEKQVNGEARETRKKAAEVKSKEEEEIKTKEEEEEDQKRKDERKRQKEAKEEEIEQFKQNKFRFKEKELMDELAKVSSYIAEQPLGRDRMHRRYWSFKTVDGFLVENDDEEAILMADMSDDEYEDGNETETEAEMSADEENGGGENATDSPSAKPKEHKKKQYPKVTLADILNARNEGQPFSRKLFNRYKCDYPEKGEEFLHKSGQISNILHSVSEGIDPVIYSVRDSTKWFDIDSTEQLFTLVDTLNERGMREHSLKNNIVREKSRLEEVCCNRNTPPQKPPPKPVKKGAQNVIDKSLFKNMDEYLEAELRDSLLEFEERVWVAGLGGIPLDRREAWRKEIEEGMTKLIQQNSQDIKPLVNGNSESNGVKEEAKISENDFLKPLVNGNSHSEENMEVDSSSKVENKVTTSETITNGNHDPDCEMKTVKALPEHMKTEETVSRCSTPTLVTEPDIYPSVNVLSHVLIDIMKNIEKKYLKPPLGETEETKKERIKAMLEAAAFDDKLDESIASIAEEEEKKPSTCLSRWEESLSKATSYSQIFVHLLTLDRSTMWDKSVQNARCRTCRRKGDEEQMLLCDGCDRGFHMYCLKPALKNVPKGKWFCVDCKPLVVKARNKRSSRSEVEEDEETEDSDDETEEEDSDEEDSDDEEEEAESEEEEEESDAESEASEHADICTVCSEEGTLILCEDCPRAYHVECCYPPMRKVPRGQWNCQVCTGADSDLPHARRAVTIERKREKAAKDLLKPKKSQQHQKNTKKQATKKQTVQKSQAKKRPNSNSSSPNEGRSSKRTKVDLNKSELNSQRSNSRNMLKQCSLLINELCRLPEAEIFLEPVDVNEVPDYLTFIDTPMDFGTIKRNMNMSRYADVDSFLLDLRLVFSNCETYNQPKSEVALTGVRLSKVVEKKIRDLDLE